MPHRLLARRTPAPNPNRLLTAAVLLVAVSLAGCGAPSYPRQRLAESLVDLCRQEYGLEVKAQMAETTLGVLVVIPGLLEALRERAGGATVLAPVALDLEGRVEGRGMAFEFLARGPFARVEKRQPAETGGSSGEESPPIEQLRQVSTALNRVCLSTDADIQFYVLIARDPGPEHLDVLFSGHVTDSKRVQFQAISISDFQIRNDAFARLQPEYIAEQTVSSFLQDLSRQSLTQLLGRYAVSADEVVELLPKVLTVTVELQGRQHRLLEHAWPIRQIGPAHALVVVPLYPIGDPGSLLVTVRFEGNRSGIEDLERLETSVLPSRYRQWGSPATWESQFHVEPLTLPEFLVQQIRKRVLAEFEPIEEDPQQRGRAPEAATPQEVTQVLVKTAAYVTNSYEYSEFERMTVTDSLSGTRWVVPAGELPLFLRRHPPELQPIR